MQKTIKRTIEFSGVGLHTGQNVRVRLRPALEDSGLVFVRGDIEGRPVIKAEGASVVDTNYATTLGSAGVTVSTVEHILAALYCLGVDNAVIEVFGPEVPVLDGSAARFVEMITDAGLAEQSAMRRSLVIKKSIKVTDGDKYILLLPTLRGGLTVDYSIDFSHALLKKQRFTGLFSRDIFIREIASARTFGFLRDVEMLRANGLARGGSLGNAVVVGEREVLNEEGLRYPDEFVRHKVLDLMGDLAVAGAPIVGHIVAYRSGHGLNHKLVKAMLRHTSRWELREPALMAGRSIQKGAFVQKAASI